MIVKVKSDLHIVGTCLWHVSLVVNKKPQLHVNMEEGNSNMPKACPYNLVS